MRLTLHLVRHGRTKWNQERRYLGHEDQGILIEGLEELLPLRERLHSAHFARIYCSDLLRCRQTLGYILSDSIMPGYANGIDLGRVIPGVRYDQKLRELDFGDWEGKTYEDMKENSAYRRWIDDPEEVTPPGGEGWVSFCSRIEAFLAELSQDMKELLPVQEASATRGFDADVLVVTHGGVIRQIAAATRECTDFWATSIAPGEELKLQLVWDGQRWQGTRLCE